MFVVWAFYDCSTKKLLPLLFSPPKNEREKEKETAWVLKLFILYLLTLCYPLSIYLSLFWFQLTRQRSCLDPIISCCGLLLNLFFTFNSDPYLNTDAGTMSPFEHGEVFVLDDGGEVRLISFILTMRPLDI